MGQEKITETKNEKPSRPILTGLKKANMSRYNYNTYGGGPISHSDKMYENYHRHLRDLNIQY